jgi:hypothetical protein
MKHGLLFIAALFVLQTSCVDNVVAPIPDSDRWVGTYTGVATCGSDETQGTIFITGVDDNTVTISAIVDCFDDPILFTGTVNGNNITLVSQENPCYFDEDITGNGSLSADENDIILTITNNFTLTCNITGSR